MLASISSVVWRIDSLVNTFQPDEVEFFRSAISLLHTIAEHATSCRLPGKRWELHVETESTFFGPTVADTYPNMAGVLFLCRVGSDVHHTNLDPDNYHNRSHWADSITRGGSKVLQATEGELLRKAAIPFICPQHEVGRQREMMARCKKMFETAHQHYLSGYEELSFFDETLLCLHILVLNACGILACTVFDIPLSPGWLMMKLGLEWLLTSNQILRLHTAPSILAVCWGNAVADFQNAITIFSFIKLAVISGLLYVVSA